MVSKALTYSRDGVFIDVTSGHMLSRGSLLHNLYSH